MKFYTLRQQYCVEARQTVEPFQKKWTNRRDDTSQPNFNPRNKGRIPSPSWMWGVTGCFVCGEKHNRNTRHPGDEVTAAITKLKERHPTALIMIEDLDAVQEMCLDEEDNGQEDNYAQWAEDEYQDEYEDEQAYAAIDVTSNIEQALANNAFLHGMNT